MSERADNLRQTIQELTDNTEQTLHHFYRSTVIDINGYDISLDQSRQIDDDASRQKIKEIGARAFATTEWFNDINFLKGGDHEEYDVFDPKSLWLDALYPLDFFDERPRTGSFSGGQWHDQYYASTGLDDTNWYSYVDPKTGVIERLNTNDISGIQAYNDVYKYYLRRLDEDPTIDHSQTRDLEQDKPKIIGGKILYATLLTNRLQEGSAPTERRINLKNAASVWLWGDNKQYRINTYDDAPATVEVIKLDVIKNHKTKAANEELLDEALQLLDGIS
jgi:hypothetical protein